MQIYIIEIRFLWRGEVQLAIIIKLMPTLFNLQRSKVYNDGRGYDDEMDGGIYISSKLFNPRLLSGREIINYPSIRQSP